MQFDRRVFGLWVLDGFKDEDVFLCSYKGRTKLMAGSTYGKGHPRLLGGSYTPLSGESPLHTGDKIQGCIVLRGKKNVDREPY